MRRVAARLPWRDELKMQPNEVGEGKEYKQQKTRTPHNMAESIGKAIKKGKGSTPKIIKKSHHGVKGKQREGNHHGVKATRGRGAAVSGQATATRTLAARAGCVWGTS